VSLLFDFVLQFLFDFVLQFLFDFDFCIRLKVKVRVHEIVCVCE